jgi:acyl carrier protein
LFSSPEEQSTAIRLALFFASIVGDRITRLRPSTKVSEVFLWADSFDAVELAINLEKCIGREIEDDLAADFDQQSFRELVEYALCNRRARENQ